MVVGLFDKGPVFDADPEGVAALVFKEIKGQFSVGTTLGTRRGQVNLAAVGQPQGGPEGGFCGVAGDGDALPRPVSPDNDAGVTDMGMPQQHTDDFPSFALTPLFFGLLGRLGLRQWPLAGSAVAHRGNVVIPYPFQCLGHHGPVAAGAQHGSQGMLVDGVVAVADLRGEAGAGYFHDHADYFSVPAGSRCAVAGRFGRYLAAVGDAGAGLFHGCSFRARVWVLNALVCVHMHYSINY